MFVHDRTTNCAAVSETLKRSAGMVLRQLHNHVRSARIAASLKALFKVAIVHVVQFWCDVGKLVKIVCGQGQMSRAIARNECEHQMTKSICNHLRFTCVPFWKNDGNMRKKICALFGNAFGIYIYICIYIYILFYIHIYI